MATAASAAKEFISGPRVPQAAERLLSQFPLPALCDALGNAREGDAAVLVEALESLAEIESVCAELLNDPALLAFLRAGASATDGRVRRLVARLLARLSASEEAAATLASAGLAVAGEQLLLDDDTGTAEAAARTICRLARSPVGREEILRVGAVGTDGTGVAQRLQDRLGNLADVQRIRVLHLFVELGQASDEMFGTLEKRGAYKEVIGAFLTDDILLKLNAVELMEALGSFRSGQELLSKHGVPEQLVKELTDPTNDASVRMCVARLLGFVLHRAPETLGTLLPSRDAVLAQVLAEFLRSRDSAERLCALNAWAAISDSAGGLTFFLRWPEALQAIIAAVSAPQADVCKGALACWASVLENWPPRGSESMDDGADVAALWTAAESTLLQSVLATLQGKPFPDIRTQTWRLLAALAQSWTAAKKTLASDQMRDLLLDFSSETQAEPRIAKHEFVMAVTKHHGERMGCVLDESIMAILEEYARQGPHWSPQQASTLVGDGAA